MVLISTENVLEFNRK